MSAISWGGHLPAGWFEEEGDNEDQIAEVFIKLHLGCFVVKTEITPTHATTTNGPCMNNNTAHSPTRH